MTTVQAHPTVNHPTDVSDPARPTLRPGDRREHAGPISNKQLNANRNNAKKSTGPKTPEGKAAVAANAVKHGLCAQRTVIPGEDPKEWADFLRDFFLDLQPGSCLEQMLVHRIALAAWRLKRAGHYEVSLIEDAIADRLDAADATTQTRAQAEDLGARAVAACLAGPGLGTLSRYESGIERGMFRAMKELRILRKNGDGIGYSPLDPTARIEAEIEADMERMKREDAQFETLLQTLSAARQSAPQSQPQAHPASPPAPPQADMPENAKQSHFARQTPQVVCPKTPAATAENAEPPNRPGPRRQDGPEAASRAKSVTVSPNPSPPTAG